MMRSLLPLGAVLLGATAVLAAPPSCSLTQKCPEDSPCCSQYGQCGVGAYCLGGCDPRMSFGLDSCVPAPVCESKTYSMANTDGFMSINDYLGDPKTADWVYQGEVANYTDGVILTMPAHSVGTVAASTTYMWYGNVKAKLRTSRGAGVVTAFILFGDVKDEIDYEFVGTELDVAQTNYYFQGIPNYDNSANISLSNTYANFHEYEIQWTPDEIRWLVDGQLGRTKKRSETWNATANQWAFPQTPSRVQLSIWPAGADTNAKGTIDWAGGPIDWDSQDIKDYGYYFATFGEITIECYNAKSGPGTNNGVSYYFNDASATNNTVIDSKKPTVLKSFQGSGTDMDAGAPSGTAVPTADTVPGGTGQAPGQVPGGGTTSSDTSSSGSSSSGGSSSGDGSSSGSTSGCDASSFTQSNCGGSSSSSTNKSDGVRGAERMLGASAVAVVIGFAGLLLL
ncbi:concanavalin A-like lectin/glucanase domain-containing protein [Bombardia bombarda]|uniref:Crh-like protein n=1 Tax=Bombardia bombarda TaxID=252184 RepID=A0AA39TGC9_9PEZI|nr:concanavalin A-like lectin/glucanase domain-containing protein [Bombardia bombarda]